MPNLRNTDSVKYDLTIKSSGSSCSTSINSNTTQTGKVTGKQTISIKGGDSIESDGTKDIVISKGKLSTK